MSEVIESGCDRFVRYPELKDFGIPYSPQHLTQLEKQDKFPKRIKLSARCVAWRLSDLRRWMDSRQLADHRPRRRLAQEAGQ